LHLKTGYIRHAVIYIWGVTLPHCFIQVTYLVIVFTNIGSYSILLRILAMGLCVDILQLVTFSSGVYCCCFLTWCIFHMISQICFRLWWPNFSTNEFPHLTIKLLHLLEGISALSIATFARDEYAILGFVYIN